MQELLPKGDWQMAAIMGLKDEQVEEICKKVKSGFVVPANYNSVGQVAISGEANAIAEAEQIAKEMGAKKVRILKTAGPFHTEKLIESSNALRGELGKITINKEKHKVIKNIDGESYKETDDIRDILAKHIINPVRFSKTIQTMINDGIDLFLEIGPRKNIIRLRKKSRNRKRNNNNEH